MCQGVENYNRCYFEVEVPILPDSKLNLSVYFWYTSIVCVEFKDIDYTLEDRDVADTQTEGNGITK